MILARRWFAPLAVLFVLAAAATGDNQACLDCHGLEALRGTDQVTIHIDAAAFRRSMHGHLACLDCHRTFEAYPHRNPAPVSCRPCHDTPRRVEGRFHRSGLVQSALRWSEEGVIVTARERSVSGPPDAACLACHADSTTAGSVHAGRLCVDCHADARAPHGALAPPACGGCHVDEAGNYATTAHGAVRAGGDTAAPSCASCHGGHGIRPVSDSTSPVHPRNVAAMCLACHGLESFARARGIALQLSAEDYAASVHGHPSPERDLAVAATCVDCHGAHTIRSRGDARSSVAFARQASMCGRCHEQEASEYRASAHGRGLERGEHEVPVCSDCHGEHAILPHTDPRSPVHRLAVAQTLCLGCHDRPALQAKYGLPSRVGLTYLDSYHGLAARGRSASAAVCIDCHGTHGILGEDDPASTIHPSRRTATCGRCHTDATERFASSGPVHFSYGDHWLTSLVRFFYRAMIAGTLGGMLVWVLLLTLPALRRRWAAARLARTPRFLPAEIAQHAVLVLSFVTLAVTGFALAFPDAAWVQALGWLGMDEELRGLIHRVAAVLLVADSLVHLALMPTRRGRWMLARMLPRLSDIAAVWNHLRHALGLRAHAPHLGHFAYFEKAEYWALVWGTAIMSFTGLVLWFPEPFPRLMVAVCEAVHYYEALLAVGAILIWHSYFVLFEPDIYPLNTSMFLGRAPEGSELADRTESSSDPDPKPRA